MAGFLMYPRGYVSIAKDQSVDESLVSNNVELTEGDAAFMTLYKNFISHQANTDGWDYQSQVIKTAMRLFGNFATWAAFQASSNDHINGLALAFLKDTVGYIRTGQRHMSVITWRDLIEDHPEPILGSASRKRIVETLGDVYDIVNNPIGLWVSRPDGFGDLIVSLYTFFGTKHSALMNPIKPSYGRFLSSQGSGQP